ncbi:MAG TPA: M20/M25/M40 family metallo-hydrolase [Gemmatimonadales bacterium]|nr:M20/M25/M40 family metallo-hydrolase [Gemmatimonadales bacterium]
MRRSWSFTLLALPLLAACGGGGVTAAPSPKGATEEAITPGDLRTRISIFAADSMAGRRTGTPGNVKGNAYIAAELARLGLTPAGDAGSFLQQVPLTRYAVAPGAGTLRVGSAELKVFEDYHPYQTLFEVPARSVDGAQLVYIGGSADSAALPAREALQGKVVVFRSNAEGNTAIQQPDLNPQGRLGLVSGVMITRIDPVIATFEQVFRAPHLTPKSDLQVPPGVTQPRIIFLPTGTLPRLFGKDLAQLHPGDVGGTITGDVTFEASPLEAANVVAVLEGSDPSLRGEYVALGAHNDAIGVVSPVDHDSLRAYNSVMRPRGANDEPGTPTPEQWDRIRAIVDSMRKLRPARLDSIVNGADDDGSGSMGLLEVAEALARTTPRPRRSLLFVWHTGEESGLQGSRWFTDHPTVPRDSIVGQINMDMISRGGPKDESTRDPAYIQVIGSRRLSTELGDLAETVNRDGKHGFQFDYSYDADGHPDNFYCRSDHAMYARYGIPVTFFSTGGHRDYHQVTDEMEYQDFDKYARVVGFVADLTKRVADLDHRLVVDKPKPDPQAPCKQ